MMNSFDMALQMDWFILEAVRISDKIAELDSKGVGYLHLSEDFWQHYHWLELAGFETKGYNRGRIVIWSTTSR